MAGVTVSVLDANVIIAAGSYADTHHAEALGELRSAIRRGRIGMAELTLAEVLVAPYRQGTAGAREEFLAQIGVEPLPLGEGHYRGLAKLRAESGLTMPDAVVLFAALREGGDIVLFDRRLTPPRGIAD